MLERLTQTWRGLFTEVLDWEEKSGCLSQYFAVVPPLMLLRKEMPQAPFFPISVEKKYIFDLARIENTYGSSSRNSTFLQAVKTLSTEAKLVSHTGGL